MGAALRNIQAGQKRGVEQRSAHLTDPAPDALHEFAVEDNRRLAEAVLLRALAHDAVKGKRAVRGNDRARNALRGKAQIVHGNTCGVITREERGTGGFGYDSLFFSNDLKKTFAEATEAEKNSVSHRGRALKGLLRAMELGV